MYDLTFWQVRRIIRGYRKRSTLTHQLLAEMVYASIHTMRDPKGKTVPDLFPALFADDDETEADFPPLTEEEVKEMQDEMAAYGNVFQQ